MYLKRIVILDCCGQRFSKIVDFWTDTPVIGETMFLEIHPGCGWTVMVKNILPPEFDANPYKLEVLFTTSDDESLFSCLCDCLGEKGWFENKEACLQLNDHKEK